MLSTLPEWARLARLSEDELVLVAFYRACTPEVRDSIAEFCRISAESCNKYVPTAGNVIFLPHKLPSTP